MLYSDPPPCKPFNALSWETNCSWNMFCWTLTHIVSYSLAQGLTWFPWGRAVVELNFSCGIILRRSGPESLRTMQHAGYTRFS